MSEHSLRPQTGTSVSVHVEGMSCAACVGRVERALLALPDVGRAQVNLATERATVTWAAPGADDAAEEINARQARLIDAIQATGYAARIVRDDAPRDDTEQSAARERQQREHRRQLGWAALLTAPLFVLEMGAHVIPGMHAVIAQTIGMQANWVIQFLLTSAVLFGPGRSFYTKGLPALWRRAPDMNALVAVGTLAAYLFSTVATFAPGWLPGNSVAVYFEAAAVIVTLVLLGRYLEARARGRSSEAIGRLLRLQPATARVRRGDRTEDIPLASLSAGDLVEVRPGERLPADGAVTEGDSHVDESMITGEVMPVRKGPGDAVTGGTINQQGALTLRVQAVGAQTVLAQIIRMVEQAQAAKLPIQALVDRITLWFVPVIMALAALTFAVWLVFGPDPSLPFALVNAVAVLIVACPCAMGLATPTSIMVGTGRGAQMGVVFRRGEALQTLKDTAVVAFDKTGTLTVGEPTLTDMVMAAGHERRTVLAQVAAVESRAEHPVARALVRAAHQQGLSWPAVQAFQTVTGQGVRGEVDSVSVQIGSDRYMRTLGLDPSVFGEQATQMAGQGKSPMYVAVGGQLAAILAVADDLKPGARAAIDALHAMHIKVAMISGDDQRTARAIAARLGIDEVVAEVLPDGKVAAVERLQAAHGTLAFVGDGINDAPALAQADVGIAVGSGTDIAIESADVVLMTRDLHAVAAAVTLSRATLANIRQNLFWAFAYNAALVPVAAGVLYPFNGTLLSPMLAAGAMALSSVFVVGNALRLRRAGTRGAQSG